MHSYGARFIIYWLPVVIWLCVIFTFSGDAGSTRRTSRFITPILRWLMPNISDAAIRQVQTVVRKTAHLTEYAILAALLWRALRRPFRGDLRPWNWREASLAWMIAFLFAVTDEWHQSFVPERQAQAIDVLIDASGALLGVAGVWTFGRRLRKW